MKHIVVSLATASCLLLVAAGTAFAAGDTAQRVHGTNQAWTIGEHDFECTDLIIGQRAPAVES